MNEVHPQPWMKYYPDTTETSFDIPEVSLFSFLEDTVEKYGQQTAIIYEEEHISYNSLKSKTDRLAGAWRDLGAQKGNRIGLMLSNVPLYIISYYAALKLGLIIVQINPQYTQRELTEILTDSDISYLAAEPEQLEKVLNVEKDFPGLRYIFSSGQRGKEGIKLLDKLIENASPLVEKVSIKAKEDIAVIQYTGGTTGRKKGAMLTHFNLVANVLQSKALYGEKMLFGCETILTAIPLYHVFGMTVGMNMGIYTGATNLLVKKFETEKVLNLIKKHQPTFFPGVPKMYTVFVNYPGIENYGLDSFKICSSGSAPLPVEIIHQFEKLTGSTIGEGYGLSETSPSTHRNPPYGIRKVGSIGLPLPGTDCQIVDDLGETLPPKAIGELLINGPQVMLGYWNKPEETMQAIRDGWFYTGDLAMMDEEGYFYIVGRKKEMIIVGGFNVYPQEVEGVLYEHPSIKEAAVIGVPDHKTGELVKAFVVPKEGKTINLKDLKEFCYQELTRYKVPKEFEIIEELPRNSVGKILKRLLVEKK
ncbi:long-chain-fatty-acid--CoA ligase [Neobacillus terrae]|uniref:long-chain-fatty-acid--CoA ligase n=1 Tax=Neobacillus terrae TaxID=3034837 RepID=UPI001409F936|nr:long-chain fatty acid--CoA ligase [Neobacillus terrae]NHM31229.1 long-chain fatty acid--CoA ligase [Neobacillus terrae]